LNQLLVWPVVVPLLTVALGYFVLRYTELKSHLLFITVSVFHFVPLIILAPSIFRGKIFVYNLGGWMFDQGIVLVLDRLSFFILTLIAVYFLIAFVWSKAEDLEDHQRFYILLTLAQAGMGGLALTSDIFNMYVFLEILSISLYALAAYNKTPEGLEGGFEYIIIGSIAGFFILWGIGLTYSAAGNLNLAYLATSFQGVSPLIKVAVLSFFTVGLGLKFAIFPLHAWKIDVMTGAPAVVNLILAGIAAKVPLYCLLRIYSLMFGWDYLLEVGLFSLLAFLSVLTIFVGHLMALQQNNLKRLLAYSSVAHIGYIVAAVSIAVPAGVQGALFHVLNHGLMKGGLFLIAGALLYDFETGNIDELKGVHYKRPFLSVSFLILSLGMIGMPPLNGFLSKWQMVMATMASGAYISSLAIIIGGFLALLYYSRIIVVFFTRPSGSSSDEKSNYQFPLTFKLPIYALVFISLAIFIFGSFTSRLIDSAARPLFETRHYIEAVMEGN
jgi:proton-translocating NADH-quinone oxidoreductase chain N